MDPVNLAYYALICGGLAAAAPRIESRMKRVAIGLGVGAISAAALPFFHQIAGV